MPEPQDFEIVATYQDDPGQQVVFRGKDPALVAEAMRKHAAETKRQLTFDGSNYAPEVLSLFQKPGQAKQLPSPDPANAPGVPEGQWNAMKRRAMQTGEGVTSGLLSGGGIRGAAIGGALSPLLGAGIDSALGESPERPIRQGEVLSGALGATVSPLSRFLPFLKNAPVTREVLGGGAAGAGSTLGTSVPVEEGALLGAGTGGVLGFLGNQLQKRLRVSGGETNRAIDQSLTDNFGAPPIREQAELQVNRDELRAIGDYFLKNRGAGGSLAKAVEGAAKEPSFDELVKREVNQRTAAKTYPILQAGNQRRGAEVKLRGERSQEAVRRVLETREISELEKKLASARTSGERAPLELERDAKLLGVAARRANLDPNLKKAMSEMKTAEAFERKVKSLQARAKSPLEAEKVANDVATSFYDDLTTGTGFDPRTIAKNPETKAALDWVVKTHPEVMMKDLFSSPEMSTARVLGMEKLFGAGSKEMTSIRRAAVAHMFNKSLESEGIGAGKVYNAAKLGKAIDSIEPLALDKLFQKTNSVEILRGIENTIATNASARSKKPLHGFLAGGLGAGSVVFMLQRETDPSRVMGTLATLGAIKIVGDNLPDLIEKIMLDNSPTTRVLRRYLANPTPGNAGVLQAAHLFSNFGQDMTKKSTEPTQ